MKKVAKALTISATIMLFLSVLGTFCLFLLDLLSWFSGTAYNDFPILSYIPVYNITYLSLTLLVSIALCFTVCSKKPSFWSEIVLPGTVMFVLSPVSSFVYTLYGMICEQITGDYISFRGGISELINIGYLFIEFLVPVAVGFLLVACGMSIAYKHLTCKQEKELCADSEEQIFPDAV